MKFTVVCAVIVALALVQVSSARSAQNNKVNNEWGQREKGDKLLFREHVIKGYSPSQIVTKDVPFKGALRITSIKATDQYTEDNGGFASILNGGPGYTDVTIHLNSQRNHGFNFIVEIYGF